MKLTDPQREVDGDRPQKLQGQHRAHAAGVGGARKEGAREGRDLRAGVGERAGAQHRLPDRGDPRALPEGDDEDELVDAQYAGPKALLRPIYDAVVKAARALGPDVGGDAAKSQVTLSRATSFAVVRAATKTRVDVALKLRGEKPTGRFVLDPKATGSDPSTSWGSSNVAKRSTVS